MWTEEFSVRTKKKKLFKWLCSSRILRQSSRFDLSASVLFKYIYVILQKKIHKKRKHFKVNNFMVHSTFPRLYSFHLYLVPKLSLPEKKTPYLLNSYSAPLHFPATVTTNLLSVFLVLAMVSVLQKWNYKIFTFASGWFHLACCSHGSPNFSVF